MKSNHSPRHGCGPHGPLCACAQGNIEKNALNKSPSLRAEHISKFDKTHDNSRFIEALIGLD